MPRLPKTATAVPASGDAGSVTEPAADAPTYSLDELASLTDIPYGTLTWYVRAHRDRLPSQGQGRGRRFPATAIDTLRQIRRENHEKIGQHWRKRSRPMARWEEQRRLLQRLEKKATEMTGLLGELKRVVEQARPGETQG
ncbi:MAG: hypothetical protein WAM82_36895 [Thermoanaerobaculia bacterium]